MVLDPHDAREAALVEEACKKSALLWLDLPGRPQPQAAWHVWHDGATYVVSGGIEQPLPGLDGADMVTVTVRSKDKGGRLVRWVARVVPVPPGAEGYDDAVAALHAKRLNAPDGEAQPARWARESQVTRLEPTGEVTEAPGRMSQDAHAAPPVPTPATTRGRLPFVIGRGTGRTRQSRGRAAGG